MTSPSFADRRAALRARLTQRQFVSAPGVFDLISARIADEMGFAALYMTGYGTVASHLGLPDAGLATYSDMVGRVAQICRMTATPLVADADTGYGGLLNVQHTVQGYEQAGAAGVQIEDQEFPKKCGHTPGRRVIATDLMVRKIQVAVEARRDPNTLIIARTDARTSLGIDEAIARGKAYEAAGADVLFIESPESEAEMIKIGKSFSKPLLANMVDGGKTPVLSRDKLQALGYAMAIFPGTIRETGSSATVTAPLHDFMGFNKLMGFEAVWAFDKAHAED